VRKNNTQENLKQQRFSIAVMKHLQKIQQADPLLGRENTALVTFARLNNGVMCFAFLSKGTCKQATFCNSHFPENLPVHTNREEKVLVTVWFSPQQQR